METFAAPPQPVRAPVAEIKNEPLHNTAADRLVAAMKGQGDFYRRKNEGTGDNHIKKNRENLAIKAELQASGLEWRLQNATQLAIDIQAARVRAGDPADLDTVVDILLAPKQPTERGVAGLLRRLSDSSIGQPMIESEVIAGPDELYEKTMMSAEQAILAQEGEDNLLRQLGVLGTGQTEASLYMGDANRIRGAGIWNSIDEVVEDVDADKVKGKVLHIVSLGLPHDSHGAVGTLPGNESVTFLTWRDKAAVHFRLSKDAWVQAIEARMPKAEIPASAPIAAPSPIAV